MISQVPVAHSDAKLWPGPTGGTRYSNQLKLKGPLTVGRTSIQRAIQRQQRRFKEIRRRQSFSPFGASRILPEKKNWIRRIRTALEWLQVAPVALVELAECDEFLHKSATDLMSEPSGGASFTKYRN
jgi:hypothetical protein